MYTPPLIIGVPIIGVPTVLTLPTVFAHRPCPPLGHRLARCSAYLRFAHRLAHRSAIGLPTVPLPTLLPTVVPTAAPNVLATVPPITIIAAVVPAVLRAVPLPTILPTVLAHRLAYPASLLTVQITHLSNRVATVHLSGVAISQRSIFTSQLLVGKKGHWEKYVTIGQRCAEFLRLSIREIPFLSFASACLPCLSLSVIHIERPEIRGSSSWFSQGGASAFYSLPFSFSVHANT